MKVIVLGAGHVGRTLVDALHAEHDLVVIDTSATQLSALAGAYDVRTVQGDGTTRAIMQKAGVEKADVLIAGSPKEEANLVCALLAKRLSDAKTVVRTTSLELLEAWRGGEIDVDCMVSPELETATAIAGVVGLPAARQAEAFADGKVQLVEFDVPDDASGNSVIGRPLGRAAIPEESKVVALIRGDALVAAGGEEQIRPGDRIVVVGSPAAAQAWSRLLARDSKRIDDLIVFGAGRMGTMIARVLLDRGLRVRLVDARADRAHATAEDLPDARVFHADAFDPGFLDRQRVRHAAAVYCMADDARNLYGAVLAQVHGARLTITLVHDPTAVQVYERGNVDVAINPREVTAERMVRFAHDPRIRQVALLEDHRFEVMDLTVRPESSFADMAFKDMPARAVIGAVIRDDAVVFPHGSDVLRPGDRVIMFAESSYAASAARQL
jgi:trk system potassium uptake protein TrkA